MVFPTSFAGAFSADRLVSRGGDPRVLVIGMDLVLSPFSRSRGRADLGTGVLMVGVFMAGVWLETDCLRLAGRRSTLLATRLEARLIVARTSHCLFFAM